jgi:hypothetical protein
MVLAPKIAQREAEGFLEDWGWVGGSRGGAAQGHDGAGSAEKEAGHFLLHLKNRFKL